MKLKLLTIALFASVCFSNAQEKSNFWKASALKSNTTLLESKRQIPQNNIFELDVEGIKTVLTSAPNRFKQSNGGKIISFPNENGEMEKFSVYENSIMAPELAANYPGIKSYIGIGIDNPTSTVYFSLSPLGFQSMLLRAGKSAVFIEPLTEDLSTYSVYKKADKVKNFSPFECSVINQVQNEVDPSLLRPNADDSTLRTFRLAVSATGEYTAYFGGTKAQALAAINATMTRVNGVFEKDFAIRMVLIANTDLVIYTNASTDPYTTSYNSQVQSTLTSVIGEANYDVGHLFVRASNNGNAGCIGCVCVNGSKGSAFTSSTIPTGDTFDIDYVAHEIGHQFGANHTFSFNNEGTGANMEPGSGSTIMGYAGITPQDVQPNSDAYFHAFSIQQVTNNVKNKTCQTNTATGNAVPTANAGLDYTIPKSTPFMLTGAGTDANGDVLTFNWEQFDNAASNATGANSAASATRTSGPTFRSYSPSTSPIRYFPNMSRVLAGATTTAGTEITVEALPSVARTMNFRLTVRDNRAGGSANNSDDMVVTVNGTAGPFTVTAPNTAVSYAGGSTQTITWNVAGTTANGVNCANVDILISTNGGSTWSTLLASTPNDGSQAVTIPNTPGNQNRIMVKGTNHIFFDVSNANFTITAGSSDTVAPTAPTLVASGTTSTSTNLSWSGATDNVAVTGYDVYQGGVLIGSTTTATTFAATGLTPSTSYTFNVRAKDAAGNVSVNSNTVNVTTLAGGITYCTSQGNSVADEYIGRVQIGTINNVSGGVSGYVDYTSISTNLTKGASATITITPTWTGSTYSEGYAVFIDYNQNGVFTDAGETVWSLAPTSATPVSGTFTVPTTAVTGATRMRVSMKYNGIPTACETFPYGQVEDYTVNLIAGTSDTTPPTAPTLTASGTTQTSTNLAWSGATDNVGVTGYDVYRNGTFLASTTTTTYAATGLTASTAYTFYVRSKDAAGNVSGNSNTVNVTTLANTVTYCASQGNSTADEYINRVQLGTINNLSGNNSGYGNFTNLSTNLVRGTSNTITITPAWTSTVYREGYRVWIDWNRDGDFLDSGEQVVNVTRTNATPIARSFTVPNTALLGQTRMRVSMKYNASPTACEAIPYGEVEDYTVNIVSSGREGEMEIESVSKTSITLYPNPVKDGLVYISSETNFTSYRIINLMGQVVATGKLDANSISVSSLASGTYLLEVSNNENVDTKRFIKQ
ncbi:GEVED domain-containing protein [Flavobacterium azooxidireducens]|uniref:GEVED domain-containing protein n=1 Tax=Flavobacterium azooxidireducens TaxID=1871076 RepID=A0ABY4KIT0_9FLAO|nr:GEVED domain-containing protein [Flavobacterium azooxidireducens]UPQ80701.1 GEVED domain-containing protein [Flavobacterium azooxidireducens]